MKQETIDQLMIIAGITKSTGCIALRTDQIAAMLEAAYEAGQRDQKGDLRTDTLSYEPETTDGLLSKNGPFEKLKIKESV